MLTALAQNTSARQAQSDIFFWLVVLICIGIALAGVAILLRKWLGFGSQDPAQPTDGNGFSLAELRRLYDQGQLSDAEFENAKKLIIARSRAAMDQDDSDD